MKTMSDYLKDREIEYTVEQEAMASRVAATISQLKERFDGSMTLDQVEELAHEIIRSRERRISRDYPRTIAKALDGIIGGVLLRKHFYKWLAEEGYLVKTPRKGITFKEPSQKAFDEGYARKFTSKVFDGLEWQNVRELVDRFLPDHEEPDIHQQP
jgi:hypothetical protein